MWTRGEAPQYNYRCDNSEGWILGNLLCTFIQRTDLEFLLAVLPKIYKLKYDTVFVFENSDNANQLYCTYNVIGQYDPTPNTISVHRKSETNTLYSINALNEIIKKANNGILDKKFQLEWQNYENTLLLTRDGDIVKTKLEFVETRYLK